MHTDKIIPIAKSPLTEIVRKAPNRLRTVQITNTKTKDRMWGFTSKEGAGVGIHFAKLGGWGGANGVIKHEGKEMPFHATLMPGATPEDILEILKSYFSGKCEDITAKVLAGKEY